jgi:hypothetical protein
MKIIKTLVTFGLSVLFAAFAVTSDAATKQFSISATSAGNLWTLTYKNGTQGGGTNSNINSVTFVPPFHVSNVAVQPSLVTSNTVISPASCTTAAGCDPTTISISFINGIPPSGGTGYVNMNGTVPNSAQSCSSGVTWSAQAFTGNALGGTNFQPVTATTNSTVSCILQFLTQPANAQAGTNITSVANSPAGAAVQVQALVGGAVATWFDNKTITLTPSPAAPIGGNAVPTSSGIASFGSSATPAQAALTLSPPDSTGIFTLTASAPAGSGFLPAVSDSFKIFAGVLNCGADIAPQFINPPPGIAPGQPGYAQGMRNQYNKDGVKEECVPVLYSFTNTILTDDTVHLAWDTASQPNAAFMYQMNWRPRPVVSATGWPVMPRPMVAWLNADGSDASIPGTPKLIPGLACLNGQLPTPYGTLGAQVNPGDATITVTGIKANSTAYGSPPAGAPAVPALPFPVVIANTVNGAQSTTTERMTVTGIASMSPASVNPTYTGTYTITFNVTRGGDVNGGSNANATHAATYRVMSTPLPIIPDDAATFSPPGSPYVVKTQAHMCIAEHGFDSFNMVVDPNTGLPTAQITWFTTAFDIGDGWVGLR